MLNINLFIAAGVITSPAICLGIQERKTAGLIFVASQTSNFSQTVFLAYASIAGWRD